MAKTSTMSTNVNSTSTVYGETTGLCFGTHLKQKLSQSTMIESSPARRARDVLKISGKRFSILLIRALAMAPAGPQTENSPGKSRQGPGKVGGHGCPNSRGRSSGPPRALQERLQRAPRELREGPSMRINGWSAERWPEDSHKRLPDSPTMVQYCSKRAP